MDTEASTLVGLDGVALRCVSLSNEVVGDDTDTAIVLSRGFWACGRDFLFPVEGELGFVTVGAFAACIFACSLPQT